MEFLSGVYEGRRTTGTAVTLMIRNLNTRSGDYAKTADLLRPATPTTAYAKYEGLSGRARRRALRAALRRQALRRARSARRC